MRFAVHTAPSVREAETPAQAGSAAALRWLCWTSLTVLSACFGSGDDVVPNAADATAVGGSGASTSTPDAGVTRPADGGKDPVEGGSSSAHDASHPDAGVNQPPGSDGGGASGADASADRDAATACAASECVDGGTTATCQSTTIHSSLAPGAPADTLLFVYDRSASMAEDWNGQSRLDVVHMAVQGALAQVESSLTVGGLFFPSPDPDADPVCIDPTGIVCQFVPLFVQPGVCVTTSLDSVDQIDFQPVAAFLSALDPDDGSTPPYQALAGGQTPLLEALQQAALELARPQVAGRRSVAIISDGAPNCAWDASMAAEIVEGWTAAGVQVNVVGLPSTPESQVALDDLATAAGSVVFVPQDAATLEQLIVSLVEGAADVEASTCMLSLDDAPDPSDELHLVVRHQGTEYEVPRDLGGGSGWSYQGGRAASLSGRLCAAAVDGRVVDLRFEVGCLDLPSLPAL